MTRKQILNKRMLRLTAKKQQLEERAKASTDAAEVRALTEELADVNAEITETREELDLIEAEERAAEPPAYGERAPEQPAQGDARNAQIVGSFGTPQPEQREENVLESLEYRQAFRELWTNGTPIPDDLMARARAAFSALPEEQRAGSPISTSNTAVIIPLNIMREVINIVRTRYGNIYSKVKKTSLPGGIEFPIGEFEAEFHWVTEDSKSPEQDVGTVATIKFAYFEAELRIARTFLSALLSIDAFDAEISNVIARAYMKFMDNAIVNGDGKGKVTGLAVSCPKTITMTAAQFSDWKAWEKRFFAELVPGYEDGAFVMARSTVIKYLKTMEDGVGNPICRDVTGLDVGKGGGADADGYFFGRDLMMTVPTIVKDFDTAAAGDAVGYYFQPELYDVNENFGFTVDRYYSHERRKWITVATAVTDGKPINSTGFVKIVKG